ncbi:LANO_0C08196g1_1 [Lachancea nothofagi CBS 11611]|uniref:LANO_0C08196g1_1 n=1 Tax=Lachancea nothofagi CBS 11611 TaxID=1266666 RepID=A0A1G4J948_9SACH|nr:LANO_0C08196g1_1 [Lachancea nothofagi CBS 11611]
MTQTAKRIAIIGAGPGGLAVARAFLANTNFELVLYERKSQVGGVWYYPKEDEEQRTDSAMYDVLETNLSKEIMQFSGFPFPNNVPTFPSRSQVQDYLVDYYQNFVQGQERATVHLNCAVKLLEKIGDSWHLHASGQKPEVFDFVIVANGHFDVPYIPTNLPGYKEWVRTDPKSQLHSKHYNTCTKFRGKRVIVVGNGSSGTDIANQISSVAQQVFHSVKDMSKARKDSNPVITPVPVISQLAINNNRTVTLQNGTTLPKIDYVIWATGYMYSVPFLHSYKDQLFGSQHSEMPVTRLWNLWRQVVFTKDPTLAFSLLCKNVVPFPLAEAQACLMTKVFSCEVEVPPTDGLAGDMAAGKDYHSLVTPRDIEYCRELQGILDSHNGTKDRLQPVRWDNEMAALRYDTAALKAERNKTLVHRAMQLRDRHEDYSLE